MKWFEDHSNLIELAEWLEERGDFYRNSAAESVSTVIAFFEKPHKYQEEWNEMQDEKEAGYEWNGYGVDYGSQMDSARGLK